MTRKRTKRKFSAGDVVMANNQGWDHRWMDKLLVVSDIQMSPIGSKVLIVYQMQDPYHTTSCMPSDADFAKPSIAKKFL